MVVIALQNQTYGYMFSGAEQSDEVAWFPHNSKNILHPIGQKTMNALGLYDMNGNVSEWLDTSMDGLDNMRYYCGGSFHKSVTTLSQCDMHSRGFREDGLGFRLVRSPKHL